eukprot:CAMPEP_0206253898 /NCGR_PEP_ID=MMETSP0047_2-20121206/23401_1 /ASSEMBLY_ACC=CAM_ASM_000192 /TAXON_ID=195065 /ORGANISM="Chroomonas mesostigmatica_cf, Strain CCMP1168" /LENGTH=238 /DNA_ID=CAMNT_0053680145 /DNA_START=9 /DNA_END=722 /DNA_ORIENTATION=-
MQPQSSDVKKLNRRIDELCKQNHALSQQLSHQLSGLHEERVGSASSSIKEGSPTASRGGDSDKVKQLNKRIDELCKLNFEYKKREKEIRRDNDELHKMQKQVAQLKKELDLYRQNSEGNVVTEGGEMQILLNQMATLTQENEALAQREREAQKQVLALQRQLEELAQSGDGKEGKGKGEPTKLSVKQQEEAAAKDKLCAKLQAEAQELRERVVGLIDEAARLRQEQIQEQRRHQEEMG